MNKKTNTSTIILVLAMLFISVLILFINKQYVADEFLSDFLKALSISGIVTGVFSFISERLHTNRVEEILKNELPVLQDTSNIGLNSILYDWPFSLDGFKNDFIKSKDVYVIMNDGKAFLSKFTTQFSERANSSTGKTVFILLDYEKDDLMGVLTRKNEHENDVDYYKRKIPGVITYEIKHLVDAKDKKHKIEVYLNPNYQPLSVVVTENYAAYSIFRNSLEKGQVPHFLFRKGGAEYEKTKADVMKTIDKSRIFEQKD